MAGLEHERMSCSRFQPPLLPPDMLEQQLNTM